MFAQLIMYPENQKTPDDTDPLLFPPPQNDQVEVPVSEKEVPEQEKEISENGKEKEVSEKGKVPEEESEYLIVTVSDPKEETIERALTSGESWMTYLITTRTNIPEYEGSSFVIRRRFSDFVLLSDQLINGYHGIFVPPRPDKCLVESQMMQKQEFVKQRRGHLEKYLMQLASHPVLRKTEELRDFLQGKDLEYPEFGEPTRKRGDFLSFFKAMRQLISNNWDGGKPPVEEEDQEYLENKARYIYLNEQLIGTSEQAELLVKYQQRLAETMGELGLALIKLAKFENENSMFDSQQIRFTDMKNAAIATVKASRLYRELNAQTVEHLDALHEHLRLIDGVATAFSDRSNALLAVQTLLSDLSSYHSSIEKLQTASSTIFGNDQFKAQKVEELKEKIKIAEHAKNIALGEYEQIKKFEQNEISCGKKLKIFKENNRSEIKRLDKERKNDFLTMLKGFVTTQVEYTEKVATEWAKVAEGTSHYVRE